MTTKNTLRAWTLFLPGGVRLLGAHEYTPPPLTIVKTSYQNGGMDAPVDLDDGMEGLTCSFKIYGYTPDLLQCFGMQSGTASPVITARQAFREGAAWTGLVEELQGMITSVAPDPRPNSNKGDAALNVEMSLEYYRSVYNGVEQICVIPDEFVRRINGVNVLEGGKNILRI